MKTMEIEVDTLPYNEGVLSLLYTHNGVGLVSSKIITYLL